MKCFSIDLDGTLLNSTREISEENVATLKYLHEQGHYVIINSGRAIEDVLKFEEIRKLNLPIISINGTVIYSENRDILFEASIPISTYKKLFSLLSELGLGIMVYTNQGGFPFRNPDIQGKSWEEIESMFANYNYDQIFEKDNLKIYKVMAVTRPDQIETIDLAKKAVAGKLALSVASSHPDNIEFTSVEANKGTALLRYQKHMKISFDEIYAFGDGGNDVEQFKVATTAIAMANAPLEVQKEADIITKTNDENGFTYAVRELLKM
ncbi:HAD family hydrolase [Caldifermentibacillus hisashii]|jgi:Cof subfamily protein (haloacid dehalogenase superfamily)|uniref:HAD family hydrolase n=1 Tax=Caldifermentibacillus hisashii TaxID=996558 RepID=UPI002E1DE58B|nr:HAD family hydrolase [Caldifermentibacillus hisashii]